MYQNMLIHFRNRVLSRAVPLSIPTNYVNSKVRQRITADAHASYLRQRIMHIPCHYPNFEELGFDNA